MQNLVLDNSFIIKLSCDDLKFYKRIGFFSNYYLFGSEKLNSFIRINAENYDIFQSCIELIRAQKTVKEITNELKTNYSNTVVNLDNLFFKLKNAGFIEGSEPKADSDMDILGLNIFTINFKQKETEEKETKSNKETLEKKERLKVRIIFGLVLLAFISFMALYFVIMTSNSFSFNFLLKDEALNLLVIYGMSAVVILFHELGHLAAAKISGIKPKSFSMGLYLGVIPFFYFKYRGIKIAKLEKKVFVIFGGVLVNLILSLISGSFYLLNTLGDMSNYCLIFSLINILYVMTNLLPSRFGDGYFLITTILGEYSVRLSFIQAIADRRAKTNKVYAIYMIVSYVIYIFFSVLYLRKCFELLSEGSFIYGFLNIFLFFTPITIILIDQLLKVVMLKKQGSKLVSSFSKCEKDKHSRLILLTSLFAIVFSLLGLSSNIEETSLNSYYGSNGKSDVTFISSRLDYKNNIELSDANSYNQALLKNNPEQVTYKDSQVNCVVFYTDISKTKEMYYLGEEIDDKPEAIVNNYFVEYFTADRKGSFILNSNEYSIGGVSEKFNYICNNLPAVIINVDYKEMNDENISRFSSLDDQDRLITFIDFGKNKKKINTFVDKLEECNFSYINHYYNFSVVVNQIATIKTLFSVVTIVVAIIGVVAFSFLSYLNIKKSKYFWDKMSLLGTTRKTIRRYSFYGYLKDTIKSIFIGIGLGMLIIYLICYFRKEVFYFLKTPISIYLISIIGLLLLVLLIFLITFSSCYKKQKAKGLLNIAKENNVKDKGEKNPIIRNIIKSSISISLLVFSIVLFNMIHSLYVYVISFLLIFVFSIILFNSLVKIVYFLLSKTRNKNFSLIYYSSKLTIKKTSGLSSLILASFLSLSMLVNLTYSCKEWAYNNSNSEYNFSLRLSGINDEYSSNEIISFNDEYIDDNFVYYSAEGKIEKTSCNIFTCDINYTSSNHRFEMIKNLNEEEVILSSYLAKKFGKKVGDNLPISITTKNFQSIDKEAKIIKIEDTYDWYGNIVYVSPNLISYSLFRGVICDVKLNGAGLEKFEGEVNKNLFSISTREKLIENQVNSIVNGVDILEIILAFVVLLLLIIMVFSIGQTLESKMYCYRYFKMCGINSKDAKKILSVEWVILCLITLIFFIAFSPLLSKVFLLLNVVTTGFGIVFANNILLMGIFAVVVFILPLFVGSIYNRRVSNIGIVDYCIKE